MEKYLFILQVEKDLLMKMQMEKRLADSMPLQ